VTEGFASVWVTPMAWSKAVESFSPAPQITGHSSEHISGFGQFSYVLDKQGIDSARKEVAMSQLVVCKSKNGIVLGADSHAVMVDAAGNLQDVTINRLIQLSTHSAILSGGTSIGENMCRSLRDFIAKEDLHGVRSIYEASLPFLATEYERFMRKTCELVPLDPLHQVSFILAGYDEEDIQDPFRLFLMWTKRKLPQLDGDEITTAFTVPRIMRLEYRLSQLRQSNASLEQLLAEVRNALEKQALALEEVVRPFHHGLITVEGFKSVE
jgi:hypothetical protein